MCVWDLREELARRSQRADLRCEASLDLTRSAVLRDRSGCAVGCQHAVQCKSVCGLGLSLVLVLFVPLLVMAAPHACCNFCKFDFRGVLESYRYCVAAAAACMSRVAEFPATIC